MRQIALMRTLNDVEILDEETLLHNDAPLLARKSIRAKENPDNSKKELTHKCAIWEASS